MQCKEEVEKQFVNRNEEAASLKRQVREMERKVEEMGEMAMQQQCEAQVKKELEKVLATTVKHGLRDLPFEMVCA